MQHTCDWSSRLWVPAAAAVWAAAYSRSSLSGGGKQTALTVDTAQFYVPYWAKSAMQALPCSILCTTGLSASRVVHAALQLTLSTHLTSHLLLYHKLHAGAVTVGAAGVAGCAEHRGSHLHLLALPVQHSSDIIKQLASLVTRHVIMITQLQSTCPNSKPTPNPSTSQLVPSY